VLSGYPMEHYPTPPAQTLMNPMLAQLSCFLGAELKSSPREREVKTHVLLDASWQTLVICVVLDFFNASITYSASLFPAGCHIPMWGKTKCCIPDENEAFYRLQFGKLMLTILRKQSLTLRLA